MEQNKKLLKPLTSFRFFAALGVFMLHLPKYATMEKSLYLPKGYVGVSFFFVLSGFVLAYNYWDRIDRACVKDFYVARFSRIYPLHFLTFFLVAPFFFMHGNPVKSAAIAVLNLSLVQAWVPIEHVYYSFNLPSWTISVEFFFYTLFPFLVFFIRKRPALQKNALWIIAEVWLVAMGALIYAGQNIPVSHFTEWAFTVFPLPRLIEFVFGIMLYCVFKRGRGDWNRFDATCLEAFSIALVALIFWLIPSFPKAYNDGMYLVPAAMFMMYVFAFQKGALSDFFSHPFLVMLGDMSFAFYMLHYVVQWPMELFWPREIPQIVSGLVQFFAVLVLSYLSFRFYEGPSRNWIKKLAR